MSKEPWQLQSSPYGESLTSTTFTVTSGETTIANATLTGAGSVSGVVSDASGPLANVCVTVYAGSGSSRVFIETSAPSTSSGAYSVGGLGAGSYTLVFDPTCNGQYSSSLSPLNVSGVSVSAGVTTTVNVTLGSTVLPQAVITVTSPVPSGASVGGMYEPIATSTSGDAVEVSVDNSSSSVCQISGGVVNFITAGTCVIDFNDPGNASYASANQVQQSVTVGPALTTMLYTGDELVVPGNFLSLSAVLASGASSCQSGQSVQFALCR